VLLTFGGFLTTCTEMRPPAYITFCFHAWQRGGGQSCCAVRRGRLGFWPRSGWRRCFRAGLGAC
jgi:hypothetical protein